MRLVAYFFIVVAFVCFADAIRDEMRGVAAVSSPTRSPTVEVVRRIDSPKLFEGAMFYQWSRAGLTLLAGVIILGISRRADQSDPFGQKFNESGALDDLERTLDAEQKRRRRPFHIWHD